MTRPGITRTVTTPTASTTPPTVAVAGIQTGAQLNAAGYAQMQAHDYQAALPLLQRAVLQLAGSSQIDEAYADYNLAYTLSALGQCTEVLQLLDRAQQVEGEKTPIDELRQSAEQRCGPGAVGPGPGRGRGRNRR